MFEATTVTVLITEQLPMFEATTVTVLTTEQLPMFEATTVTVLTAEQRPMLEATTVTVLTTEQLPMVKATTVAVLTMEQKFRFMAFSERPVRVTITGTTRTYGQRPENRQPKREKWVARLLGLAVWISLLLLGAGAFLACRSCSWPFRVSGCPVVVVCLFFFWRASPGRSCFCCVGAPTQKLAFLLDVWQCRSPSILVAPFLGTQMRECQCVYYFGPAFQNEEQCTVLVARAGLDCAVNRRDIKKVRSSLEVEASANSHLTDAQRNMRELSVDYLGKDWTMAGKLMWQGAFLF